MGQKPVKKVTKIVILNYMIICGVEYNKLKLHVYLHFDQNGMEIVESVEQL